MESPQYSPPVGAEELLWRRGMVVMENVSAPRDAELLAGLLGKGLTPEVLMRIPKRSCTESIRISQHTSDQSYSMNSRPPTSISAGRRPKAYDEVESFPSAILKDAWRRKRVHSRFAVWFCVFMRVFVRIFWGLQIFVSWIGESSSSRGDECDVCGIASV